MMAYRTVLIRRKVEEIPSEKLVEFLGAQGGINKRVALRGDQFSVDLQGGEIRIGQGEGAIVIRLRRAEVRGILQRLKEGGRLEEAYAWVGPTGRSDLFTFNVALVFAKETEPYQPTRLTAVDVIALHNGVVWATVDGERVLQKGVYRPDLGKIGRIQREISRLEALCASGEEDHCERVAALRRRVKNILRQFEDETAKKLVMEARRNKAVIVVSVPDPRQVSDRGSRLNAERLRRRIRELASWYGVPYREDRLYSAVCPRCGIEMGELSDRKLRCQQCGFEAPREKVLALWAQRRFSELI